jgi:hypothetical protein
MALSGIISDVLFADGGASASVDVSFAPSTVVANAAITQLLSEPDGFDAFRFAAIGIDSVEITDPSTGATSQQALTSGGRASGLAPAFAGDNISRVTYTIIAIGSGVTEMLAQLQVVFLD